MHETGRERVAVLFLGSFPLLHRDVGPVCRDTEEEQATAESSDAVGEHQPGAVPSPPLTCHPPLSALLGCCKLP